MTDADREGVPAVPVCDARLSILAASFTCAQGTVSVAVNPAHIKAVVAGLPPDARRLRDRARLAVRNVPCIRPPRARPERRAIHTALLAHRWEIEHQRLSKTCCAASVAARKLNELSVFWGVSLTRKAHSRAF